MNKAITLSYEQACAVYDQLLKEDLDDHDPTHFELPVGSLDIDDVTARSFIKKFENEGVKKYDLWAQNFTPPSLKNWEELIDTNVFFHRYFSILTNSVEVNDQNISFLITIAEKLKMIRPRYLKTIWLTSIMQ